MRLVVEVGTLGTIVRSTAESDTVPNRIWGSHLSYASLSLRLRLT